MQKPTLLLEDLSRHRDSFTRRKIPPPFRTISGFIIYNKPKASWFPPKKTDSSPLVSRSRLPRHRGSLAAQTVNSQRAGQSPRALVFSADLKSTVILNK